MYLETLSSRAGMAQRLDNPAPGDAYPRHILASINTSTDLPKIKEKLPLNITFCPPDNLHYSL